MFVVANMFVDALESGDGRVLRKCSLSSTCSLTHWKVVMDSQLRPHCIPIAFSFFCFSYVHFCIFVFVQSTFWTTRGQYNYMTCSCTLVSHLATGFTSGLLSLKVSALSTPDPPPQQMLASARCFCSVFCVQVFVPMFHIVL